MSGIAGAIDLAGHRLIPADVLRRMAEALRHRGPDDDAYDETDGVSLALRRLRLADACEHETPGDVDGVAIVFDGVLYDTSDLRKGLEQKGHRFRSRSDAELIARLWQQYGERIFDLLQGQYAFALHDRKARRVLLARDRFGICPLYWARSGDWLLFGSEIRAILASGLVEPRPDLRGINQLFTFIAVPGPITCFQGVQAVAAGRYLDVVATSSDRREVRERKHWDAEFPNAGEEERGQDPRKLTDALEEVMLAAVARRMQSDVPTAGYLSGGVDSGLVVALANKLRGAPIPTYTACIDSPGLDETSQMALTARHIGSKPTIVTTSDRDVLATCPDLVRAAECPVIDTACAALLRIARQAHADGFKAALTGEGADEWFASYPWYRTHKLFGYLDIVPGLPLSKWARKLFLKLTGAPAIPPGLMDRSIEALGGPNPWLDFYGMVSLAKFRFFSPQMLEAVAANPVYADLNLDVERIKRWHPVHRGLYLGTRIHLPGLLLHAKGDRISMNSAIQQRYPFLDDAVFAFLAKLHPSWKLNGFTEKYLLRLLAERYLPRSIAWKRKEMFRAPFDGFHIDQPPAFVEQLLSPESLRKAGYFDVESVLHWRHAYKSLRSGSVQRTSIEMGLAGVLSTQLWHQLFIDSSLADVPRNKIDRIDKVGI